MEISQRTLMTVRQFAQKHPAFPEGGLRHCIFHAEKNGFDRCIRRVGRKILIDETAFFLWVDSQGSASRAGNTSGQSIGYKADRR